MIECRHSSILTIAGVWQTILSNLQIKLELDYQASDQVAFDDLYKRLQTAYDGLKVVKPE